MTIIVTHEGGRKVGPYIPFQVTTTLTGPFPLGGGFRVKLEDGSADHLGLAWWQFKPTQLNSTAMKPWDLTVPFQPVFVDPLHVGQQQTVLKLEEGAAVSVVVDHMDGFGTIDDTLTETGTWSNEAGQTALLTDIAANHAFTTTDRDTLANIIASLQTTITTAAGAVTQSIGQLFSTHTLDSLTLTELSPGPTSGPVTSDLSGSYARGILIRITALPANVIGMGPDQGVYPLDLAVLSVRRGTDLQERFTVHTVSKLFIHPWSYTYEVIQWNPLFPVPPDTTIEVEFGFGVEGRVYAFELP